MENFYETEVSFKQLEKIAENYFTPCKIYEICFRNTENINKALCTLDNSDQKFIFLLFLKLKLNKKLY